MDISKAETEVLLEALDHALEGHFDVDDGEETSDLAYGLVERLREHKDAGSRSERRIEARWELRSGCPKADKAVLFSAAESPRDAVMEYLNVSNMHINALGEMKEELIDGETFYHFPINCGWHILVKAI